MRLDPVSAVVIGFFCLLGVIIVLAALGKI
jgi:hypothetical protein